MATRETCVYPKVPQYLSTFWLQVIGHSPIIWIHIYKDGNIHYQPFYKFQKSWHCLWIIAIKNVKKKLMGALWQAHYLRTNIPSTLGKCVIVFAHDFGSGLQVYSPSSINGIHILKYGNFHSIFFVWTLSVCCKCTRLWHSLYAVSINNVK